ncbi:hypothetical protein ACVBEJ_08635 [Porticoccus sp. GXU_MW_L64]
MDNNELETYQNFFMEVSSTMFSILEAVEAKRISDNLTQAEALAESISKLQGFYDSGVAELEIKYIEEARLVYKETDSISEKKIVAEARRYKALSVDLAEFVSSGRLALYSASAEIAQSQIGQGLAKFGGWAVNAFGVVTELADGDYAGAAVNAAGVGVGAFASALTIKIGVGLGVAASSVPLLIAAALAGGTAAYFFSSSEDVEKFSEKLFDHILNDHNGPLDSVKAYILDNGEEVFPNHAIHAYLLRAIDPSFDEGQNVKSLVAGISRDPQKGVEGLIHELETLLGFPKTLISDASEYLNVSFNLFEYLVDNASGKIHLISDPEELVELASQDTAAGMAARYSIEKGNSFVFVSNDPNFYNSFNQDGSLNRDNYSDEYLIDKATHLVANLTLNYSKEHLIN